MSEQLAPKPSKKWKMAVVVWLAIYPLITLVLVVFGKLLGKITFLPLRTFVITLLLVPVMVFWALPLLQKILANWLKK